MTDALAFKLERSVLIRARRATVFRFVTDSERFAKWWGTGSRIEPRPGGEVHICYPGNVIARGKVIAITQGEQIVFSYGYEDPSKPIAPGGSRVTITLRDVPEGTLVELRHEVENQKTRDEHDPGWRFQLALFANAVCTEQHASAGERISAWFAAWGAPDPASRRTGFAACCNANVSFGDQYACLAGLDDLVAHIEAARRHLPSVALAAEGSPRTCQDTALVDWIATAPDGKVVMRGTNVFLFDPEGSIERVIGLPR